MAVQKKPRNKKHSLDEKVDHLTRIVERGFVAVTEDFQNLRDELKGDIRRVEIKVEGVDKRLDYHLDAHKGLEVRVTRLEAKASHR